MNRRDFLSLIAAIFAAPAIRSRRTAAPSYIGDIGIPRLTGQRSNIYLVGRGDIDVFIGDLPFLDCPFCRCSQPTDHLKCDECASDLRPSASFASPRLCV